tara:strand:+ start:103 stop:600 length:498 start_codon:yes stop_codon:yes gene_type:complete
MNFFRNFFISFFVFCNFSISIAENHVSKEILDQAKEITEQLNAQDQGQAKDNNEQSAYEEEEVPLNDPFAGNEGTNQSTRPLNEEEARDEMSLYNFKLSGLISGKDASYISLTNASGDVIAITLGQNLGKIKLVDLRLTEAIFEKEDKTYIIIDFNNQIRETDEY